jgi:hypothetical protein
VNVEEQITFLSEMAVQGFCDIRPIYCQTKWVGIYDYLFTSAIIVGVMGDYATIDNRWCYHTKEDARAALVEWESRKYMGEPDGWHRHPFSGRRRQNGLETINF